VSDPNGICPFCFKSLTEHDSECVHWSTLRLRELRCIQREKRAAIAEQTSTLREPAS
jgi:hypothetical protein